MTSTEPAIAPTERPPLRVGLVGYGMAGHDFHAPLIRSVDGLRITHVVTGDRERAASAVEDEPDVQVLPDAQSLWSKAAELDLVVLASPTGAHAEQATAALEAGLPVVVDKPFTVTAADARAVVELAESRGLLLTVFQNRRWDPEHLTVKTLLAGGDLGEIVRYEARYERWRPVPKARWREQSTSAEGGGILMDLQSHLVDGALNLFGPVATVYAELSAWTTVGDDVAFLALKHASGVLSHLGTTSLAAAPGPRTRLLGTRGAYLVAGVGDDPTALSAWADPDTEHRGWLVLGEDAAPVPRTPGGWRDFYVGVRDALLGATPPPVAARDALAVIEVLDAARLSAQRGDVVRL